MIIFYDFYYFYAASLVLRNGGNVYDVRLLQEEMNNLGWDETAYGFPYPPWSLWLFRPLSLLSFPLSVTAWTIGSIAAALICAHALLIAGNIKFSDKFPYRMSVCATLLFFPVFKSVLYGQPSILSLIAISLWAFTWRREMVFFSGLTTSLVFIKPHILLPFLIYIGVAGIKDRRRFQFLSGISLGFILQFGSAFVLFPGSVTSFYNYSGTFFTNSFSLPHPSLVKFIFPFPNFIWVPCICASLLSVWKSIHEHLDKEKILFISLLYWIPVSLLTAPYVWSHDFIILLYPFLLIIRKLTSVVSEQAILMVIVAQLFFGIFCLVIKNYEIYTVFFPVTISIFCLYYRTYAVLEEPRPGNTVNPVG